MSIWTAKTLKGFSEKETDLYARPVTLIYLHISSEEPVVSSLKNSANAPVKEVTH